MTNTKDEMIEELAGALEALKANSYGPEIGTRELYLSAKKKSIKALSRYNEYKRLSVPPKKAEEPIETLCEPTDEMIAAGASEYLDCVALKCGQREMVTHVYKAMSAVATQTREPGEPQINLTRANKAEPPPPLQWKSPSGEIESEG